MKMEACSARGAWTDRRLGTNRRLKLLTSLISILMRQRDTRWAEGQITRLLHLNIREETYFIHSVARRLKSFTDGRLVSEKRREAKFTILGDLNGRPSLCLHPDYPLRVFLRLLAAGNSLAARHLDISRTRKATKWEGRSWTHSAGGFGHLCTQLVSHWHESLRTGPPTRLSSLIPPIKSFDNTANRPRWQNIGRRKS